MLNSIWAFFLALISYFSIKRTGTLEERIDNQKELLNEIAKTKKAIAEYDSNPELRARVQSKYTRSE